MLRLSFLLEEYRPTIKYIKGTDNDGADALSMIILINFDKTEKTLQYNT